MDQKGNTITGNAARHALTQQASKKRVKAILQYPRALFILFSCLVAATAGYATPFLSKSNLTTSPDGGDSPSITAKKDVAKEPKIQLEKSAPTFKTILPAGKSIEQLGGWTKVSPPNRDPAYAYVDTIGTIQIQVSQQELPKEFRANTPDEMARLAKNFSADTKLSVKDAIAYLGTSAKGPQSVIVAKGDLLILIKSSAMVPEAEWEKYIQSLS